MNAILLLTFFLAVDIPVNPGNFNDVNKLVRAAFADGETEVRLVVAGGEYQFDKPWVFFNPNGTVTVDTSEATSPVEFNHFGKYGKFSNESGHYRWNQACIYPLVKNFYLMGNMTFDWNYQLWSQYGRFIEISAPMYIAKDYIEPDELFKEYIVDRSKDEVEVPFENIHIGHADFTIKVVDKGHWNKSAHRETYTVTGQKNLGDRWFCTSLHSSGGKNHIFQNVNIYSDATEMNGSSAIVRNLRYLNCSNFGHATTTGSAFGALFRQGDKTVGVGTLEVSGCFMARAVTRFTALGNDGQDNNDVICRNIIMKNNVMVADENPHKLTLLRIKAKSHIPNIEFSNNTLILNRVKKSGQVVRMLSVVADNGTRKATVSDFNTIIVGQESVYRFQKWAGLNFFTVNQ